MSGQQAAVIGVLHIAHALKYSEERLEYLNHMIEVYKRLLRDEDETLTRQEALKQYYSLACYSSLSRFSAIVSELKEPMIDGSSDELGNPWHATKSACCLK